MNGEHRQRIANLVEASRLQAADRLEKAFGAKAKPDPLDILIVAQWYDNTLTGQTRGPFGILKQHGPTLGVGTGLGAILLAGIQALGQIFGK